MRVREVDAGKRREEHDCGCAWLYEPPTVEGAPWRKRPVVRCGQHRRSIDEATNVGVPPEVTPCA